MLDLYPQKYVENINCRSEKNFIFFFFLFYITLDSKMHRLLFLTPFALATNRVPLH
jgi:hypothetical protein